MKVLTMLDDTAYKVSRLVPSSCSQASSDITETLAGLASVVVMFRSSIAAATIYDVIVSLKKSSQALKSFILESWNVTRC